MAKEREVKKWITVNGHHVPIYADGSMGGIMSDKKKSVTESISKEEDQKQLDDIESKRNNMYSVIKEVQKQYGDDDDGFAEEIMEDIIEDNGHDLSDDEIRELASQYYDEEDDDWQDRDYDDEEDEDDPDVIARNNKDFHEQNPLYGKGIAELRDDPEARALIDSIEEAEEEMRGRGLTKDDDDFWSNARNSDVEKLKEQYGYDWDGSSTKSTEIDQNELMDLVDKYNTSNPVSGSWDTETEHEQRTIADHFGISMDEAKQVMKDQLGFEDDQFNDTTPHIPQLKEADLDTKRAAQAQILEDNGIDRNAALEAIKERTGKNDKEAEEMLDTLDIARIKKLAKKETRSLDSRATAALNNLEFGKEYDEVDAGDWEIDVWHQDMSYGRTTDIQLTNKKTGEMINRTGIQSESEFKREIGDITKKFGAKKEEDKSITVADSKIGVSKTKPTVRSLAGDDGDWKISKAYDKRSLKEMALEAGVSSKKVNAMSTSELRQMLLAMWRKG